jgi:hypothetical protein
VEINFKEPIPNYDKVTNIIANVTIPTRAETLANFELSIVDKSGTQHSVPGIRPYSNKNNKKYINLTWDMNETIIFDKENIYSLTPTKKQR